MVKVGLPQESNIQAKTWRSWKSDSWDCLGASILQSLKVVPVWGGSVSKHTKYRKAKGGVIEDEVREAKGDCIYLGRAFRAIIVTLPLLRLL
jgi:hypothetical protein